MKNKIMFTWQDESLFNAITESNFQKIKWCLARGANVNAVNIDNITPLHFACFLSRFKIVEILLLNGADPNKQDICGETPLHLACDIGHIEITQILLKFNAHIDSVDKYNETPLHYAASQGHSGIITALLANGANLNARSDMNQTALNVAEFYNHTKVQLQLKCHQKIKEVNPGRISGSYTLLFANSRIGETAEPRDFKSMYFSNISMTLPISSQR